MYLGRNAKSKTPACIHKEWPLETFSIKWVAEEPGYNPHLHCHACGITAKKALPKKAAKEFEGYYDKPESLQACEECQHHTDVVYSGVDCLYDSSDTDLLWCDICGEVIESVYLHDNYS